MMHLRDGAAVSRRLRSEGIPVIWGGHMSSFIPEMILGEDAADYIVLGEGEVTFLELLPAIARGDDVARIRGIAYRDASGAVRRTPEREFADPADLPVIDWSLVDPEEYFAPRLGCKKVMYLYCSKGCPGRCAFCFNAGFHHSKCRRRPNEHVISEITQLVSKHGMDGVHFVDEMFGLNKKALHDLCERLRGLEPGIIWGCGTKLDHLNRDDLQMMYDAGCRRVYFGVESGSQEMQARMRKYINLEKIDQDFRYCREVGISSHCGIIIGLPDETVEQLRETVQLVQRLDVNLIQVCIFFPIPGSEFSNDLAENGRLTLPQTLREWQSIAPQIGLFANFSNVPTRDLQVVQSFFYWHSFFRKEFTKGIPRYDMAKNTIVISLRHILRQGFFNMVKYVFSSGKLFLTVAWYANAYPGIRKKYGLHAKKRVRNKEPLQ